MSFFERGELCLEEGGEERGLEGVNTDRGEDGGRDGEEETVIELFLWK